MQQLYMQIKRSLILIAHMLMQNLYLLRNCPQLVFDMKSDVVGISLDPDEVLHSLQNAVLSVSCGVNCWTISIITLY